MSKFGALDSSPKGGLRTAVHLASLASLLALLALLGSGCGFPEPSPTVTVPARPSETPQVVKPRATGTPTPAYRPLPTVSFPVTGPANLELVGQLRGGAWGRVGQ